jgi:hypothetical protein
MIKLAREKKKKYKSIFFSIVCIMLWVYAFTVGIQMWLNCAILGNNKSVVEYDVKSGAMVEVENIKTDGSFTLVGGKQECSPDEVKGYIRVPNDVKYYYNTNTNYMVSKLTISESKDVVIKFFLLDIVCTCMLIYLTVVYMYSSNPSKVKRVLGRILSIMITLVSMLMAQFAYDYCIDVLFKVGSCDWVLLLKISLLLVALGVVKFIKYRKAQPIRLKRHKGK